MITYTPDKNTLRTAESLEKMSAQSEKNDKKMIDLLSEIKTTIEESSRSNSNLMRMLIGKIDSLSGVLSNNAREKILVASIENLNKQIGRIPLLMNKGFHNTTNSVVHIGSTPTMVLQKNPNRDFAVFINDSNTKMYLYLGQGASVGRGIMLNPNGGSYEINHNNLFKGHVTASCSASGQSLVIVEGFFEED